MEQKILLEIGLEELPARFIDDAIEQFRQNTKAWLHEQRISFQSIDSFSTPRRLAVIVHDVADKQTTKTEAVRGPSKKIAQNEDGSWSKAAIGFTKGQGQNVNDIMTKDVDGKPYIFVEKITEGKKTTEILPEMKTIISSIQFKETMYWMKDTIPYARPIRWVTALYGDHIIPMEVAGVQSDRITYGHRFLGSPVALVNPDGYEAILKENFVIANADKREQLIMEGIKGIEQENNFHVLINPALLNEVRNLVEYPTVFFGKFDERYLQLPREVLIIAMAEHQRYFPVEANDELLPYFISVRNGDDTALQTVVRGNERVLEARLSDAQFFYDEDRKQPIDFYVKKLSHVIFQEELGTYDQKINRIVNIVKSITNKLESDVRVRNDAIRAAEICKFDLVTQIVNEFTELQGVIGEKYALNEGETREVAKAIREHYLPAKANGPLPESIVGSMVSIADKLDTIVGSLSIGLIPSGSQDPYGLRRQAIGVLRILQERSWNLSLEELLDISLIEYEAIIQSKQAVKKELFDFFKLRVQYILKEENIEQDVMKSLLNQSIGTIHYTVRKAHILSQKRNEQSFKHIEEALVRVLNLAKQATSTNVNESLFETESERELYDHFMKVSKQYLSAAKSYDAVDALKYLSELADPIHSFFDYNMVMDDNDRIRENRLALLAKIAELVNHYADLTAIQWKQQK